MPFERSVSPARSGRLVPRLLGFLLGLSLAYAAEAAPSAAQWIAAHAKPATDLAAFGSAIGDHTLVALAEDSHGDGAAFALKERLVEYLHEKKGFDVLFLESGLYDVSAIWQAAQGGASVAAQGPGNIFFMYSKSREGSALLDYVDQQRKTAHPLILAGIDAQHSGGLALNEMPGALIAYLKARGAAAPGEDYLALMHRIIGFDRTPPGAEQQAAFFAAAEKLEGGLCAPQPDSLHFPDSPGWWCRILRSLDSQAHDYWQGTGSRDTAMAENLHWLMDNPYKGHKAMLWAHIGHAARFIRPDTGSPSMGQVLSGFYGDRYYVATVTAGGGDIIDFTTMKPVPLAPTQPGSLEEALGRLKPPALFLDLRGAPDAVTGMAVRSFEYQYFPVTAKMLGLDGVFYLKTAKPVQMVE